MKTLKNPLTILVALTIWSLLFASCKNDKEEYPTPEPSGFVSLESPYLICSSRNPGGVGFDFEYKQDKGGANNLDSLTVADFEYDLKIITLKGEKPDGSLSGAPYIQLSASAQAVNYSKIDTTCKGITAYSQLNSSNILSYSLQSDDTGFDLTNVPNGTTGHPLMQPLLQEFNKLVIGQRWKETANNDISGDEIVWIIKTHEGRIVKFIVTDFPADPAPTSTGYIAITWDFVE